MVHEESESAKTTDRCQLQNLLTYRRQNNGRVRFLRKATQWGLINRRGQPLSSQAIGLLLLKRRPDFPLRKFVRHCDRGTD